MGNPKSKVFNFFRNTKKTLFYIKYTSFQRLINYLFFYIIAISVDAFFVNAVAVFVCHVVPARRQVFEETLNFIFHLFVGDESPSGQMFFQLREQVIVTGGQVRTIEWVSDDVPTFPFHLHSGEEIQVENQLFAVLVFGQHSWYPSCKHLPIMNFSVKILWMVLRETSRTKMQS